MKKPVIRIGLHGILLIAALVIFYQYSYQSPLEDTRYRFEGEGYDWHVVYNVDLTVLPSSLREQHEGTATYIGDGDAPETIDYTLTALNSGSDGSDVDVRNNKASIARGGCENCAGTQQDETIEVEIRWDDQSEIIKLTPID